MIRLGIKFILGLIIGMIIMAVILFSNNPMVMYAVDFIEERFYEGDKKNDKK